MKNRLLAMLFMLGFAGSAWAGSCPELMAEIDEILEGEDTISHLEADVLAEARALRDMGSALHNAGDHDEAEDKLERSLKLLGGQGDDDVEVD